MRLPDHVASAAPGSELAVLPLVSLITWFRTVSCAPLTEQSSASFADLLAATNPPLNPIHRAQPRRLSRGELGEAFEDGGTHG